MDQREILQPVESNVLTQTPPMKILPTVVAPVGSKDVTLRLRDVRIVGMHAFRLEEVEDIYAPYLDRTITLDILWLMAGQLTERYRNAGYFLSRVTVPEQEVSDGVVRLQVIEGYIGDVQYDDPMGQRPLVKRWLKRLQSYRPLKAAQIESVLLQLNDLPGVNVRAVLEPIKKQESDGAVRLILQSQATPKVSGQVSFDNNGSRFLGPYQAFAQAQTVFAPMHRTTATLLSTLPWDELKYGGLKHEIALIPGGNLELYGTRTDAEPGFTLAPQEIKSESTQLGVAFAYKFLRQRQENLSGRVAFEARNTDSDILGTPLTRDAIRALRANMAYEGLDALGGTDFLSATLSQGLELFGASEAGQLNLSRAEAEPDFTKFEARLTHIQPIGSEWVAVAGIAGQVASGPLYSAEEFGYGGQAFGRAYDESEITGDHGIAATAELRYTGFPAWEGIQAVPYGFYDIGSVWNEDGGSGGRASGSSAGVGVRLATETGISANVGVAFPLTREIANPLYGNGKNPRLLLQIAYGF